VRCRVDVEVDTAPIKDRLSSCGGWDRGGEITGRDRERVAAVTAAVVMVPDPRNAPAVDADQRETCVYVSDVDTLAHSVVPMSASFVITPPTGSVPKQPEPSARTVLPAGFAVPAAPGSPTCSLIHTPGEA
jgi:hypothetical protein